MTEMVNSLRVDLHLHSTASDGVYSPVRVVDEAKRVKLDLIALADHDTTHGVAAAVARGVEVGVRVIPALEISTATAGGEIHLLGYGIDPAAPSIVEHSSRARGRRESRLKAMVVKLNQLGVEVDWADVILAAGREDGILARPHLAQALVKRGAASTADEAFVKWIGNSGPAWIGVESLTAESAIAMIHEAGGIAMWAHPPMDRVEKEAPLLKEVGLDGLECYRPRRQRNATVLEPLAARLGMLRSGGSDWHGPDSGTLGEFTAPVHRISELLVRLGVLANATSDPPAAAL